MKSLRMPRTLTAVVVALVVGAGFTLAMAAADTLIGDDVPASYQVRAPHVGDRGMYEISLHGEWLYDDFVEGEPFEFLRFEWGEDGAVRGADGLLHDANVLGLEGLTYIPFTFHSTGSVEMEQRHWSLGASTWYFEPGSDRVIADGSESEQAIQSNYQSSLLGIPVLSDDLDGHFAVRHRVFDAGPLCFLRTPLQDAVFDTSTDLEMEECRFQGGLVWHGAPPLRATAIEMVGELAALRFDGGAFSVWYHPSVSVPLRIKVPSPDHLDFGQNHGAPQPMDGHAIIELVAFEPGPEPVMVQAGDPHSPLPALVLGKRMPWGMDDSGVTHRFPISEAFRTALADPDSGLADYLAAHPDAVAVYQDLSIVKWPQYDSYRWWIGLSDGEVPFGLEVEMTIQRQDRFLLGLDLGVPDALTTSVQSSPHFFPEALASWVQFTPDMVPDQVPTAASALERWRVALGRDDLPASPSYGAWLRCDEDGCEYQLTVGVDQVDFSDDQGVILATLSGQNVMAWDFSWLTMDADGRLWMLWELLAGYTHSRAIAATDGVRSEVDGSVERAPLAAAVIPGTGGEAVVVGLAAIFSYLLYWLWPAIKSTPFVGLFSRLQTPKLLDHPNRRLIAGAVEASPGIHFKQLQRTTGLANGTLRHHLRHLVEGGLITEREGEGYTCYFRPGRMEPRAMQTASLLKSDGSRAVLATVHARPGITAREVAHCTGLSPGTVAYHVDRLARCGAVEKGRAGRTVGLHAPEWIQPALDAA